MRAILVGIAAFITGMWVGECLNVVAGQESFRRDVHVCEAKYADQEVQRLCKELDLHKEEFARFVAMQYSGTNSEPVRSRRQK